MFVAISVSYGIDRLSHPEGPDATSGRPVVTSGNFLHPASTEQHYAACSNISDSLIVLANHYDY
jgi:hypothetical protein